METQARANSVGTVMVASRQHLCAALVGMPCFISLRIVDRPVDIALRAGGRHHLTRISQDNCLSRHVEVDIRTRSDQRFPPNRNFSNDDRVRADPDAIFERRCAKRRLPRLVAPIVTPCAMLTLAPKTAWGLMTTPPKCPMYRPGPMLVAGEMSKPYLNR